MSAKVARRLATAAVFWTCWLSGSASAQSVTGPALTDVLAPGMTVWITDATGREVKTRIVDVSADAVATSSGERVTRYRAADIRRVRARHFDPVWNGAAIGAASMIITGLSLCRLMEPWDTCVEPRPLLQLGAMGAGIGIGIDAIWRGRRTIYEAGARSTRVSMMPILTGRAQGAIVQIAF